MIKKFKKIKLCIVAVTTDKILPTKLEKYFYSKNTKFKEITLSKKMNVIIDFLNYSIEHNLKDLRYVNKKFLEKFCFYYKNKKRDIWDSSYGIKNLYIFLYNYKKLNKEQVFHYKTEDLFVNFTDSSSGIIEDGSNIKCFIPNKELSKKEYKLSNIPLDHFEVLLDISKDIDPMLTLAFSLQAYAGLKIGELANINLNKIKVDKGEILIDIREESNYIKNRKKNRDRKKSDVGSISNFRIAKIIDEYIDEIRENLESHIEYLNYLGIKINNESPLFYNSKNEPMKPCNFYSRSKKLFDDHFIPLIQEYYDVMKNKGYYKENLKYLEYYNKYRFPGTNTISNIYKKIGG